MNQQKECCTCHAVLDTSLFNKNRTTKDGHSKACKKCHNAASKKYRQNNLEAIKPKQRVRQKRLTFSKRQFVLAYAMQHGCIDCGEKDPVVLEFDHVRDTKVSTISRLVSQNSGIEAILNEIKKCDVRCANCHRRRTAIQLVRFKDIDFSLLKEFDLSRPLK